jgi:regulator of protease activity HflC (stomatin/prohibitin superfamily)
MSSSRITDSGDFLTAPPAGNRWRRLALLAGVPLVVLLVLFLILWNVFYHYVPPGHMLVIVAKSGEVLDPDEVLAEPGQKGIQREVRGEGWHFIMPILNTTERKENVVVGSRKVGIVTALGGKPPRDGRVLAEKDDEKGIRRKVLLPGSYRLNPYGYDVKQVPMTEIHPGYVGILRRRLGTDSGRQFATKETEKGIVKNTILQPGIYPVNTEEYEVIHCEVGVSQTTYNYNPNTRQSTAITFPARDGNIISLDCTVEWELKPDAWPDLLARRGSIDNKARKRIEGDLKTIERIVVDYHAKKICRDRGNNYGAQDFLDGVKREEFQENFKEKLKEICEADNVGVRSAYIRNIVIPDNFLEQKRLEQLAVEQTETSKALTETARTKADVEEAQRTIDLKKAVVEAETARMVAVIEQKTKNLTVITEAQINQIKAKYGAEITALDAQRDQELGEAKAKVTEMRETAKSALYRMKMDVFKSDGDAYLRYSMAQQLNPNIRLRLFQSGPGTLWTNLGDKNMNLFLPLPAATPPTAGTSPGAKSNGTRPEKP